MQHSDQLEYGDQKLLQFFAPFCWWVKLCSQWKVVSFAFNKRSRRVVYAAVNFAGNSQRLLLLKPSALMNNFEEMQHLCRQTVSTLGLFSPKLPHEVRYLCIFTVECVVGLDKKREKMAKLSCLGSIPCMAHGLSQNHGHYNLNKPSANSDRSGPKNCRWFATYMTPNQYSCLLTSWISGDVSERNQWTRFA